MDNMQIGFRLAQRKGVSQYKTKDSAKIICITAVQSDCRMACEGKGSSTNDLPFISCEMKGHSKVIAKARL